MFMAFGSRSDDAEDARNGLSTAGLVVGGEEGTLTIIARGYGQKEPGRVLEHHLEAIRSLAVVGNKIFSASEDGQVTQSSFPRGNIISHITRMDSCRVMGVSATGLRLAVAGLEPEIRVVSTLDNTNTATLKGHKGHIRGVAFDPQGEYLASAGADGEVRLWSCESGKESEDKPKSDETQDLLHGDDDDDGNGMEWTCQQTLTLLAEERGRDPPPCELNWSADGEWLAIPNQQNILLLDRKASVTRTLSNETITDQGHAILGCKFVGYSGLLVAYTKTSVQLWDAQSGELVDVIEAHGPITDMDVDVASNVPIIGYASAKGGYACWRPRSIDGLIGRVKTPSGKSQPSATLADLAFEDDDDDVVPATVVKSRSTLTHSSGSSGRRRAIMDSDNDEDLQEEANLAATKQKPTLDDLGDDDFSEEEDEAMLAAAAEVENDKQGSKVRKSNIMEDDEEEVFGAEDLSEEEPFDGQYYSRHDRRPFEADRLDHMDGNGVPGRPMKFSQHSALQPGATEYYLGKRFLAYNDVGMVVASRGQDSDLGDQLSIEFHESDRRAIRITDHHSFTLGALNRQGALFANEEKSVQHRKKSRSSPSQASTIFFKKFEGWGTNMDWTHTLPHGESARCVALLEHHAVVATSKGYLRIFGIGGVQDMVLCLPGNPVAVSGDKALLFVVYNLGATNLGYWIYNTAERRLLQEGTCPVTPNHHLTWLGFQEDTQMPVTHDSAGVLRGLISEGAAKRLSGRNREQAKRLWLPLLETTVHKRGDDGMDTKHQWVYQILGDGTVLVAVCRRSKEPRVNPRSSIEDLQFRLPMLGLATEAGRYEETYMRETIKRTMQSDAVLPLRKRQAQNDIALLKMLEQACQQDRSLRALDLMMRLQRMDSIEAAIKVAGSYRMQELVDRMQLVRQGVLAEQQQVALMRQQEQQAAAQQSIAAAVSRPAVAKQPDATPSPTVASRSVRAPAPQPEPTVVAPEPPTTPNGKDHQPLASPFRRTSGGSPSFGSAKTGPATTPKRKSLESIHSARRTHPNPFAKVKDSLKKADQTQSPSLEPARGVFRSLGNSGKTTAQMTPTTGKVGASRTALGSGGKQKRQATIESVTASNRPKQRKLNKFEKNAPYFEEVPGEDDGDATASKKERRVGEPTPDEEAHSEESRQEKVEVEDAPTRRRAAPIIADDDDDDDDDENDSLSMPKVVNVAMNS
eukprot:Clim_evm14s217 gene=Clim_evmTU14s217